MAPDFELLTVVSNTADLRQQYQNSHQFDENPNPSP
jgi:hypothetical protein